MIAFMPTTSFQVGISRVTVWRFTGGVSEPAPARAVLRRAAAAENGEPTETSVLSMTCTFSVGRCVRWAAGVRFVQVWEAWVGYSGPSLCIGHAGAQHEQGA